MNEKRYKHIGLFSSDPDSRRVRELERAFKKLGVNTSRVIPWLITQICEKENHTIELGDLELTDLDLILVLDLGANDIGAFFNRVGILTAIKEMGVEVVNSVASTIIMRNKAETLRKLIGKGLPVPKTLITESIEDAAEFVRHNAPCVLKPITGFGGIGVQLIESDFVMDHIYDYFKFHSQIFGKGAFILQELINSPGFDIRALVLDGEVIGTMQRVAEDGFVTNIKAGGTPRANEINVDDLAVKAAGAVNGRLVGVDIIPDIDGNLWVLEVNATPGWTGLQKITEKSISDIIAGRISRVS